MSAFTLGRMFMVITFHQFNVHVSNNAGNLTTPVARDAESVKATSVVRSLATGSPDLYFPTFVSLATPPTVHERMKKPHLPRVPKTEILTEDDRGTPQPDDIVQWFVGFP